MPSEFVGARERTAYKKKKQEQFEFTFENVLAKLNMVIWVSLRFFFLFFSLSLFSRPIYNAANALRERIKGFFLFRFNLCDTSVYERLACIVPPTLGRQPERTTPAERPPRKSPGHIFRDYCTARIGDGGGYRHTCSEKPYRRLRDGFVTKSSGYDGVPKTKSAFHTLSGATCFRPDYGFSGAFEKRFFFH